MSNFTTENLIPYTGTILPGQRLIRRKDGTFLPVGVAGASSAGGGSGGADGVYLCVSAAPNMQFNLLGEPYGGAYVYDGQLDSKDVYTNGTYYVMADQLYVPYMANNPASNTWWLCSSRSWEADTGIRTSLIGMFTTSGGQMHVWTPETVSSGTWTGREMTINSAGYYEPVSSDSETSLTYTNIVPQGGQMYSADALKHVDKIWNYNYMRDIKSLITSTTNEMYPDAYNEFEGWSGPDSSGWFSVSDGYGSFNGSDWETGNSFFTANWKCATIAFKFKPVAWSTNSRYYNWIIGTGPFGLLIDIDGKLDVESYANYLQGGHVSDNSRRIFDFTFTANQEYNIVIVADDYAFSVIIDGVLVAHMMATGQPYGDSINSVTLHGGSDWSWDGCTYAYKDFSMWGRPLPELASHSSVAPLSNVTLSNTTLRITKDSPVSGLTVSMWGNAILYDGGTVTNCTVSSGGTVAVLSGGTALNVTSETGAAVIVSSGGSITYATPTA